MAWLKRKENGNMAATLALFWAGLLSGLGLSYGLYKTGQDSVSPIYAPGHDYVEGQPVDYAGAPGRIDLGSQNAIVNAVRKVGPAVVNIEVTARANQEDIPHYLRDYLSPEDLPRFRDGEGSGIIINGRKGYVLTNHHVVRDATKIQVQLKDGRSFTGQVLGTDRFSDVALVQIPTGKLPTAELGTSQNLPVGSWAIAIGNPLSFQHTVTVGVISAKDRNLAAPTGVPLENLIQTDAAINPGNSGGALCDINGNIIGMNTAIIPTAQGIGFAVDIETVKYVVDELLQHGKVSRAWMGVSFETHTQEMARSYGHPFVPGVMVRSIRRNAPAGRAGLRVRDVITAIDGQWLTDADALRKRIRRHKPGEKVEFMVARKGRAMTVPVTLGTMPDPDPRSFPRQSEENRPPFR